MSQAVAAELPQHQGLFNLAKAPLPPHAQTRPETRLEPRLVPVLSAPTPKLVPKIAPASGGAAQVQPKPQMAARRPLEAAEPMSRARFLKTLEHLAKTEESKAVTEIVARVRARELEQAIQHKARARARYLASVVDLGANRSPVGRGNIEELADLRRAHEELEKGIDALTDAIREGLVDIVGVGE